MAKKRGSSVRGLHLSRNRLGIWIWRRTHPHTGERPTRSTGERSLEQAVKISRAWDEEFQNIKAGLTHLNGWTLQLAPLAAEWEKTLTCGESHAKQLGNELRRAIADLQLETAADLTALGKLTDRLLQLERQGVSRLALRRSYQDVLRRFSRWLAGNHRYLDRDPLRDWERLRKPKGRVRRRRGRCVEPEEVGRAFLALEYLDRERAPRLPELPVFMTMLVTAPRVTTLLTREIEHLDLDEARIDFGEGCENKRTGRGALDPATVKELEAYMQRRKKSGPLFPSPLGLPWAKDRFLDRWRLVFAMGTVDRLWPADEGKDPELARAVAELLLLNKVRHPDGVAGGNPAMVALNPDLVARRAAWEKRVRQLAARLREDWTADMAGVTVHGFRTTHRTWAEARGVPGPAIDVQLGWAQDDDPSTLNVMKLVAGSRTGRRHYLDSGSSFFDPIASAKAVREIVDESITALRARRASLWLPRSGNATQAQA